MGKTERRQSGQAALDPHFPMFMPFFVFTTECCLTPRGCCYCTWWCVSAALFKSQVKCGQHRPSGPGGATEFRSCLLLHSGIRKKWASSFYSAKSVCANNCQLVAKDKHGIQSKRKAMSNRSKTRVHCVTQESSQSYTMKCRLLKTSTPPQYSLMHQGGSVKNCVFFLLSCAWQVKKLCWPLLEMYVAERKWVLCTVNEGLLKSRICLKRFFTSLHPIILHNENRMNKTTENLSF